jgi:hypothetical protein
MADDITPALIAGLAVEAEKLSAEGEKLSKELHTRGEELQDVTDALRHALEALRRYRRLVVVLAVVAVIALVGLGVIAALNLRNGAAIRSCTTPGGSCYERGQAQTAAAVAQINQAALIAAFCAAHSDTLAEVKACTAAAK